MATLEPMDEPKDHHQSKKIKKKKDRKTQFFVFVDYLFLVIFFGFLGYIILKLFTV